VYVRVCVSEYNCIADCTIGSRAK